MATFISPIVCGILLWLFQRIVRSFTGRKTPRLGRTLLESWGIFLQIGTEKLPWSVTGQMFLGWFWLFSMLIAITYRSTMVAHLTLPGKSKPIDSLEELLESDGWTWGYEPTYGSGWEWLKRNENPTVKGVYQKIQVLDMAEQMQRVLASRYAFISWKYYIRCIIKSKYTNNFGYTPIYTAKKEFFNYGGYGWGYRKGAPFRHRIDLAQQHLIEAGLINYWMDNLIDTRARETRAKKANEGILDEKQDTSGGLVVLSMSHLQGCFYLLFIGCAMAALAFIVELTVSTYKTEDIEGVDFQDWINEKELKLKKNIF